MAAGDLDFVLAPNLTLEGLCQRFPKVWQAIEPAVCKTLMSCDPKAIVKQAAAAKRKEKDWIRTKSLGRRQPLRALVEARMTGLAFDKYFDALKEKHGGPLATIRFDWARSLVAASFDPRRCHKRLPSLRYMSKVWPRVKDKPGLLKAAYEHGVFCVMSRELVAGLVEVIAGRPCLEVAAGDGRLATGLAPYADIIATDDHSWSHSVDFGANVIKMDALEALRRHPRPVVICSWPPALNDFELQIFNSPDVETYIVLGSRYAFATGNIHSYHRSFAQCGFEWTCSLKLTSLMFPAEIEGVVYVFERRSTCPR